ncbi:MAG: helix-turn-helix transcriptional regulator [Blautia sp.]|nr:helix-turn-helix transcriptional regulator [Blautia sp.]
MAADSVEVDKLGPKVKKIRLEMGLTQNEVAKALHVTPGFICNVENNRTAMSLRVLIYYAKLTGRTLDSIIGLVSSDYEKTALDNEITAEISKFSDEEKAKLLKTLKIWS